MKTDPRFFPLDQATLPMQKLRTSLNSSLFPTHTKLFVERVGGNSTLLKALLDDNTADFSALNNISHDDLKEIYILSAFVGANNIFALIKAQKKFIVDDDLLNTALLTGALSRENLDYLTDELNPSYGSIRYAIRSEKYDLVTGLMHRYPYLHFGPEHLTQAAMQKNPTLFNGIADALTDIPSGTFIESAVKRNSAILERWNAMHQDETADKEEPRSPST